MQTYEHPLSWRALGRVVAVALVVFLAWSALGILVNMLIALVIAVSLFPVVTVFAKKMPFTLAVVCALLLLVVPLILLVAITIPNIIGQVPAIIESINSILNNSYLASHSLGDFNVAQYLQDNSGNLIAYTRNIAFTFTSAVTVLFLTFYFLFDYERLLALCFSFFPEGERPRIHKLLNEIALVVGKYIRGNLVKSVICGVVIYIGLVALGVPFALPLAIFSGLLDLLPVVGPLIGMVPAIILAFTLSPIEGIFVFLLYLIYQQVENVYISPKIFEKALNLSPALIFISVVIGGSVFGIVGAFLALPFAASLPVLIRFEEEYKRRHRE